MIDTARLHLIPATSTLLRAERAGRDAFAAAIGLAVPAAWPPDLYDADAITYALSLMARADFIPKWGSYYIVRRADGDRAPVVIGAGGFKGPPGADRSVEVGYSILPAFRRRGYATEAVRGWVQFAFESPDVVRVVAQTLAHLTPSIGVMVNAGFTFAGAGADPDAPPGEALVRYELVRP